MMLFKRKQVVITIIICMVLAAGYINWAYQTNVENASIEGDVTTQAKMGEATMVNATVSPNPEAQKSAEPDATIKKAKEARDTARNKSIEMLKELVANPSSTKENKDKATAELTAIATAMEKEGICEGILATKGVQEAVVFISNGNISVTVKTVQDLTPADVSKIKDVIITNTGSTADKIKLNGIK